MILLVYEYRNCETGTNIKLESLQNLPVVVSIPYTSTLKAFPVENSVG